MTDTRYFNSSQSRKWSLYLLTLVLLAMSAFPLSGQDKFRQQVERFKQNAAKHSGKSLHDMLRRNNGNIQLPDLQLPGLNPHQKPNRQKTLPQLPPVDARALFSKLGSRAIQPNAPLESLRPPHEVDWANGFEEGEFISTSVAADAAGNNYTVGFFGDESFGGFFIIKRNVDGEVEWALPIITDDDFFEFSVVFGAMQVAVDNAGNVYVCGGVTDDAFFLDTDDGVFSLPVDGGGGIMFLACYTSDGDLEWVTSSEDDGGLSMATGIDVDSDGNIYVAGAFVDSVTLGPHEPEETTLLGFEEFEAFWAKFNSDGDLEWAKAAIGENEGIIFGFGFDGASDISVDNDGNVYIAGYFEINLAFEFDTPDETILEVDAFPMQNFIAKYTTDGDFVWAFSPLDVPYFPFGPGIPLFWSPDVAAAPNGTVYFSSTFSDFFDFGPGSFSYILAMDGEESLLWASVNFSEDELGPQILDIGTDAASSVYAHGNFIGDVLFNAENDNSPPFELSDDGDNLNVFLEKLDSEGCFQWVRSETPLDDVLGGALAVDENCVFVTVTHFGGDGVIYGAGEENETLVEEDGTVTVKYNRLHEFVFLAAEDIEIGRSYSAGDMHANDDITFNSGDPSTHAGDLSAVDDIDIARDNTIEGDVNAGGDLDNEGAITGEANENAEVIEVFLPELSPIAAGSDDVTVDGDDDVTLPPGDYRDVEVERDGALRLTSGTYVMDELELGTDTRLFVDVEEGKVNLHIVNDLEFGDRSRVIILEGNLGSRQFIIKSRQSKNIDIGREAVVIATIIASDAKVRANSDVFFRGSICAEDIRFSGDAVILSHDAVSPFPKVASDLPEDGAVAQKFALDQNYPNPFNPTTQIAFQTAEAGFVELKVFDISGRLVKTLVNENREAGSHTIQWNATNDFGQRVTSGIYLYKLISGSQVEVKKMILLK